MNLNILLPGEAVESAFKKPSLLTALVLVLLPAIASIAAKMLFGVQIGLENAAYGIVLSYVGFFALAIIAFALAWILNNQATKGKFVPFFCALSLVKIISLVIVLLSFLTMPLYLSPEAMQMALQAGNSANGEMAVAQASNFLASNQGAVNLPVFAAFLLIGALLTVYGIYVLYLCIKGLAGGKKLSSILITVIALIILGLVPL